MRGVEHTHATSLSSVIVDQVHVHRYTIDEAKYDTPVAGYSDTPLAALITRQLVQSTTGEGHILRRASVLKGSQQAPNARHVGSVQSSGIAKLIESPQPLVREPHIRTLPCNVTRCMVKYTTDLRGVWTNGLAPSPPRPSSGRTSPSSPRILQHLGCARSPINGTPLPDPGGRCPRPAPAQPSPARPAHCDRDRCRAVVGRVGLSGYRFHACPVVVRACRCRRRQAQRLAAGAGSRELRNHLRADLRVGTRNLGVRGY